jgi:hypothetical protein
MGARIGRTRPRRKSVNLAPLRWLLVHQAALSILCPFGDPPEFVNALRTKLAEQDSWKLRRDMERLLRAEPWRAQYPQPTLFDGLPAAEHFPDAPSS